MASTIVRHASSDGLSYISLGPEKTDFTLICIHGWACRATDFSRLFHEFSKQDIAFRVIAIDLPGHGESPSTNFPNPSIPTFAIAILKPIEELPSSKVVLAGHSMGVRMILETWQQAQAIQSPAIIGLCFVDGSHYKLRKTLFAFDHGDPRSKTLTNEQKAEGMAYAFKRMFSDNTPTDFQESTLAHIRTMDMQYNETMRKSFITYDYEKMDDALDTVGKAGVSVLSFQSTNVDEQNQRTPLQLGERSLWMELVQQKVLQAQQVVVNETMHFPHVDRPAFVAEKIIEFVDRLSSKA